MTVCVVGSGAREHALAHVLGRSDDVIVAPGNAGTTGLTEAGHRITASRLPAEEIDADLFVIGPEVPLVAGLADRLRARGRLVVGPSSDGARLEGSKAYMKQLVRDAGVPSAAYGSFDRLAEAYAFLASLPGPYVIKTDGLAAGKGVLVTDDLAEARADVVAKLSGTAFGAAGRRVVIEEAMVGPELSVLVLCDGKRLAALPAAQDFKRLGEGDLGPNTGGMGAFSPVPVASDAVLDEVMASIVEPSLAELCRRGIDYRGVLYAGCMLTTDGPRLIEYNVRFGDPEAEVVLPRIDGDLLESLVGVASGRLAAAPKVSADPTVGVVVSSAGYPSDPRSGDPIHGLAEAGTVEGVTIFHGGTRLDEQSVLRTAGGRVLVVTAHGSTIAAARERVYRAIGFISFAGMQFRSDIALAASTAETR